MLEVLNEMIKTYRGIIMAIEYRPATKEDAELLVSIYDAAFYNDYLRFGTCPGDRITKEHMEQSIIDFPKFVIIADGKPVGCISCKALEAGTYEVGVLCVIPEFQGKGIGTQAIRFIKTKHDDWEKLTLVTPIDKRENVKFYTEKCGFQIVSIEKAGDVELARFVAER